ncbi:DNA methyltransferase [Clostridium sp. UBA1353]|uniref:DNA methyltransferase n=1 Tax=Clostridium sp. UBA1353 TaxID=1946347 RepID=UPI003216C9FD
MYSSYEKQFNVIYPESNNATYFSLMNYSDDLYKPFQRWYRYKEGFSIDLVKELIREYNQNINGTILDPFMGSGSTLLGASDMDLDSIGFEVNPFSYFLASCKLKGYDRETINQFKIAFEDILSKSYNYDELFPLPKLSISSKVFEEHIEKYYMNIKYLIMNYPISNLIVKKLLKLGWLSCLENISTYRKAGNGLKKRKYVRPRIITVQDVYTSLQQQYINMYEDMISRTINPNVTMYNESCKNMKKRIGEGSISGIIFSPPYANCFDYTEIYKLELWFGDFVKEYTDLKSLRKQSLRSHLNGDLTIDENSIKGNSLLNNLIGEIKQKDLWDKRIPNMLRLYFNDMFCVLEDCYRVLEDKGFCSIIVGNSSYGGVIVPTDLILAQYARQLGFVVDKIEVDRYIITSSQQYEITKENKKYLRESLICLKKEI